MARVQAEIMKQYVRSQNLTSMYEIMVTMKDMLKDVLQQVIECELSEELGYKESERLECNNRLKKLQRW